MLRLMQRPLPRACKYCRLTHKASQNVFEERLMQQRVVGMNDLKHLHRCHLRLVIIVD